MTVGPVARNESTERFFDGTREGLFLIKRCTPFGHASRPQAKICDQCGSDNLSDEAASGRARLVSWAIVPIRVPEGRQPVPPVVPAIGELDEGPWWWSQISGADPSTLYGGQPLRITFERAEGGEAVPVFVVDDGRRG